MQQTKIIDASLEVDDRLKLFGVTKAELFQIAHKVVMARNGVVSIDPVTASGQFAYIYGTRALREVFMRKGWGIDRSENIEAVYNKETGIKIIYQSADKASNQNQVPRAISDKGAGSKRMVASGQFDLEMFLEPKENPASITPKVWYFFVAVNGSDVCAELSRPGTIENHQFKDFVERIFIIKSGEWDPINPINIVSDNNDIDTEEFEINVSRK